MSSRSHKSFPIADEFQDVSNRNSFSKNCSYLFIPKRPKPSVKVFVQFTSIILSY